MRLMLAAVFAALAFTSAHAAEITVLAPGFVKFAGIDDLAEAYTKETGVKVTVKSTGMGAMMEVSVTLKDEDIQILATYLAHKP